MQGMACSERLWIQYSTSTVTRGEQSFQKRFARAGQFTSRSTLHIRYLQTAQISHTPYHRTKILISFVIPQQPNGQRTPPQHTKDTTFALTLTSPQYVLFDEPK